MFWNFSAMPVNLTLNLQSLPERLIAHRRELDATAASDDENTRLHPLEDVTLTLTAAPAQIHLEPYGIQFWSLEPLHWPAPIMGNSTHPAK